MKQIIANRMYKANDLWQLFDAFKEKHSHLNEIVIDQIISEIAEELYLE
jgi:hypothetical protein